MGLGGNKQRVKLTSSDKNQGRQYEDSVTVADDSQVTSDAEMFRQDGTNIWIHLKDLSKVLKPEDLEMADETEEDTNKEDHCSPVEPRAEFHQTSDCITQDDVT